MVKLHALAYAALFGFGIFASFTFAHADECEALRAKGVPCKKLDGPVNAPVAKQSAEGTELPEEVVAAMEYQLLYGDAELMFWNGYKFEEVGPKMETYLRSLIGLGKMTKFTIGTGKQFFGMDVKIGGAKWSTPDPEYFANRGNRKNQYAFRVELIRR